eukprot:4813845-Alexandrium_andersonii.AAC.1
MCLSVDVHEVRTLNINAVSIASVPRPYQLQLHGEEWQRCGLCQRPFVRAGVEVEEGGPAVGYALG